MCVSWEYWEKEEYAPSFSSSQSEGWFRLCTFVRPSLWLCFRSPFSVVGRDTHKKTRT